MELIKENNILVLKMDAPGNNIMTSEFMDSLISCLDKAETYKNDTSVKGFIITCSGRHFSCGADIPSLMERSTEELEEYDTTGNLPKVHTIQKHALTMQNELPFPVISVVKGFCIGSGSEIAINSHIRICEPSARVGQPESTFGILPALGGIAKTAEICGLSDAIELVLTGNLISAAEADEKNWCDILCEKNQGYDMAVELIEFINDNYEEYDRHNKSEYITELKKIKKTAVKGTKKIGIIGYGKMGQDIFSVLHDHVIDAQYTVVCRHDAQEYTEKVQKNLSKGLKRGKLSEISYQISSNNFVFTTDLNSLIECDLIIETISEDLSSKQNIFSVLDKIVKESCIFATNTSSLSISEVFSGVSNHRFMGIHFFYPVKLSSCIEFNNCCDKRIADALCSALNKEAVYFENEYCFYLNQFISFSVASALFIKEKCKVNTIKLLNILYDIFPQHGLLGMVDSIGLGLFTSGDNNSNVSRFQPVISFVRKYYKDLLNGGCPENPGSYLNYISSAEMETEISSFEEDKIKLSVISAVMNEAIRVSEEYEVNLISILSDTLSISEPLKTYYALYGYDKIKEAVDELHSICSSDSFVPVSEDMYTKYFE